MAIRFYCDGVTFHATRKHDTSGLNAPQRFTFSSKKTPAPVALHAIRTFPLFERLQTPSLKFGVPITPPLNSDVHPNYHNVQNHKRQKGAWRHEGCTAPFRSDDLHHSWQVTGQLYPLFTRALHRIEPPASRGAAQRRPTRFHRVNWTPTKIPTRCHRTAPLLGRATRLSRECPTHTQTRAFEWENNSTNNTSR